jgi:subtilisin family serine protease
VKSVFVLLVAVLAAGADAGQLAPKLETVVRDAAPDALIPVIVETRAQADLRSLPVRSSYDDKVAYLKATAAAAQRGLLGWLHTVPVESVRPFWLVSRVALRAPRSVILELARRDDVATVWFDDTLRLEPMRPGRAIRDATDGPTWNIERIKADSCWADGYDGTGIVVGNIDSGVEVTHPAFGDRWREENGWFDAVAGSPTPYDDSDLSHGTFCMGLLAGGDGPGPYPHDIGVAPGASFIAAKAFDAQGNSYLSWVEQCLNWMADPGRPDVLSNSWGAAGQDTFCWASIRRLRDLGMAIVFSAGNDGPQPGTVGTPGSFPTVICVGATDDHDDVPSFSSRGPAPNQWPWNELVNWSRPDWDLICPSVVAPGDTVMSAVRGGTFGWALGTSVACPQAAGCCALLKQKYPGFTHDDVMQMITNGADQVPQGGTYPNNNYGWGRLNCLRALDTLTLPARPFVRVEAVWVVNDTNHNDTLEPGETGDLVVRLRNSGRFAATDLRGVLRGGDAIVSILDSTTNIGLLPALDTANIAADPFVLRADPTCPLGYIPDLTLALTCNETAWTYTIPLQVGASGTALWAARELRGLPGSPYATNPSGVAYNPVDNRLYITCKGTGFIHIYSSDSMVELLDSIWAPDSNWSCYDLAFSPGDTTFWILSYYLSGARVSKIRPDGTVLRRFASLASTWPAGIAWDADAHRLYQVESQYDPPSLIHITDTLGTPLDTIEIPLGYNSGAYGLTREVTRGNPLGSALVQAYEFYVPGRTGPDSAGVYMLRQDNGTVSARFLVQPPDSGVWGYHISGVEYDPRDASYWVTYCSRSEPYHKIAKYSGFYPVGIGEAPSAEVRKPNIGPTIICGGLRLADSGPAELFDINGRKVMTLKPGPNDVSRLAPGVYFVCPASGIGYAASGPKRAARLILTR